MRMMYTDKHTERATCVAIARIYSMHAMWPKTAVSMLVAAWAGAEEL